MKRLAIITSSILLLTSSALVAVPLRWTVETSRAQPATFDEFAGATYDLEATLQSYGRPLEVVGDPHLYWQTNGMASAWWSAPATVSGNVLRATWTPACDVGARAYNCFIGITGTVYNAAFQLRLRPSPGATPNALPLPTPVIDFGTVAVINPPWPDATELAAKRDKNDRIWGERTYGEWQHDGGSAFEIEWGVDDNGVVGWRVYSVPGDVFVSRSYGDEYSTNLTFRVGEEFPDPWELHAYRSELADHLALTSELLTKRDLDDLSYVTTVPGGWTPTEVDGHRYDIHYDGYSGWNVEKLTYYPDWGEWYYDDYEWVEGPEDAETLVAHKLWSDETITFTRLEVEVQDSLALVSQIGNQAEMAARNYIQNNDIAKTKTMLRTGRPGEYGTGWGTLHYQFSSDRRWWSMIVPSVTASWTTGGYVDADGNYVSAVDMHYPGSSYNYYKADPISVRDHTPIAKFVSSSGTNGSARCASANWTVGITAGPGASSSAVRYDTAADLDSMCFAVSAEVDHATGIVSFDCGDMSSVLPIEFDSTDYYLNHYTLSNFRFGEPVITETSLSVKCLYDVDVMYTASVKTNYTAWCTLNLGCESESYITVNPDYGRVMTDVTRSLYYDRGLKATWKINVTNGCFYAEIVSTNNVTEGVN